MWIDCKEKQPEYSDQRINPVWGMFNIGSPHYFEGLTYCQWNGEKWVDFDGEDLTGLHESVTHWFDMTKVEPPEIPSQL
jgi:hypothetical protein